MLPLMLTTSLLNKYQTSPAAVHILCYLIKYIRTLRHRILHAESSLGVKEPSRWRQLTAPLSKLKKPSR